MGLFGPFGCEHSNCGCAGMASRRRIFLPGVPQHVIQRGNNRGDIFRYAGDYQVFLAALRAAAVRYDVRVHAYVLMSTHYHAVLTPSSPVALARAMQSIGRRYVRYFNGMYGRTGTLFEGRYRSAIIDTEAYWFTCMRYVEMNPVRAGLCETPDAYRWSSFGTHAHGRIDCLLTAHPLYVALGRTALDRQAAWRCLCTPLTDEQLRELRRDVQNGGALGPVTSVPAP
jgi:putative transposase